MALKLKRQGVTRVHPLLGGIDLWMKREFPVTALKPRDRDARRGVPS